MTAFEKRGVRYEISDRTHIAAFLSAGWREAGESVIAPLSHLPPKPPGLKDMTVAQLKSYAEEHGINIGRARSAERIIAIIEAAMN